MKYREILFDIETNGLLPIHTDKDFAMDRIHCVGLKCLKSGHTLDFGPDSIDKAVEVIGNADLVTGHNIIDFDLRAFYMLYPHLEAQSSYRIFDTLVMSRMCFADVKESDYRLFSRGKFEGKLIGSHGLEAWGQRLGLAKGDYKKEREEALKRIHRESHLPPPTKKELHDYVWGTWNQEMHDYMILDVDVNYLLYEKIREMQWSEESRILEHKTHALMVKQEENGFFFNTEGAERLAEHLNTEYDRLTDEAISHIGKWYRPVKSHKDSPNASDWENDDRRVWGEVTVAKRAVSYRKSNEKYLEEGDFTKLRPDTVEGAKYVKIELKEFNPNSRQQIVDRLQNLYGWEPQDFTEKGSAIVDDEVLRNLAERIPLADTLAEIFFYKKRLGQVADGANGWLKLVKEDNRIHGRVNVGGTVSGRATHAAPNVSQVTGVTPKEFKNKLEFDGYVSSVTGRFTPTKLPVYVSHKWKEAKGEGAVYVRGRDGGYGWDCRELFTVDKGYKLVGVDLSGIEFRCLSHLTFPFDNGELVEIVLNGDIHQKNADLTGIGRGLAKRLLYACVDMETQALTKSGWKYYKDLREGEMVMTYNMEKDVKEWKPILNLHFVPQAKRVRIVGRGINVVCTPDHRWATIRKAKVKNKTVDIFEYCRTDELTKSHRIISNAPYLGSEDTVGDFIDFTTPKYSEQLTSDLMHMPKNQRQAWLHGFLTADGHKRARHPEKWGFTQKPGITLDASLAAFYVETYNRITSSNLSTYNCVKTEICDTRTWGCQKLEITPIEDGDVWCMTTENSSFVMRRGNFVTITGNCMYGGGDAKLGYIIDPLTSEARQKTLGKQAREKLMRAMPSLDKAIKQIKKEKRINNGTIAGLDGRRLYVRSDHAALNLRLQSDGAIIAKKWCTMVDDTFYDMGWDHNINGEYAFSSWSHDEIQVAVRKDLAEQAAEIIKNCAVKAGEYFNLNCPVAAESKIGMNWAETH